jgi:Uncharacterised nucleotidyltransferase
MREQQPTHAIRDHRSEIELILACCRNPWESTANDAVLQIIDSEIDWRLLLQLMDFHAVTLMVGRKLSISGSSGVPESVLERFRYSENRAARENLAQTAELLRILKLLQENRVEVIPFKGTVLAAQLYGDLILRQSCDIDLIIRQRDVSTAKRILASAGYVSSSCLSPAREAAFIRSACVYELWNRDRNVRLELHWKDSQHPSLPLPADFVWNGCQQASVGGLQIKTLAQDTLLLLLCAHGTKHCWQRLRHISDVAELVRMSGDIDWAGLLRKADQLGARCMLLTGLSLSHELLEAPVPDEVLRDIQKNPQVQRIVVECSEEIFHGRQQEPGYWHICQFSLRSFDNWRCQLRYLTRVLLRPGVQDVQAVRLPRFLFPLYSCVRLFRLVRQLNCAQIPPLPATDPNS